MAALFQQVLVYLTGALGDGEDDVAELRRVSEMMNCDVRRSSRDSTKSGNVCSITVPSARREGVDAFLRPVEDVAEARPVGQVGAERQHVDQQSHDVLELFFVAAGGECPYR